jgi:MarC family membrane protein
MDMSMLSAVLLLLIILDPIGNVPIFIATLERVPVERRFRVIARECLIAYVVLIVFALVGNRLMAWMHLSDYSMGIAGGFILFIIAFRMIFRRPDGVFGEATETDPFIFPMAIPLFAGPSAIAFVLLLTSRAPERMMEWILAISLASAISTAVLCLGAPLDRFIGRRGMKAMETLLGLLLTVVATQMLLDGIGVFLQHLRTSL